MRTATTCLFLFSFLLLSAAAAAQDSTASGWSLGYSGLVRIDYYLDSRQTIATREGHMLLYPEGPEWDPDGKDINEGTNFNAMHIRTRLSFDFTVPRIFGADVSGQLQGDFSGTQNSDITGLRLRHAYMLFDWGATELLIGQFWCPLFDYENFPRTVSLNSGIPFHPFGRNPQIRLTHKFNNLHLTATLTSHRNYANNGPNGYSGEYLRNAAAPVLNLQAQYYLGRFYAGMSGEYKRLKPEIETAKGYAADETIGSIGARGSLRWQDTWYSLKGEVYYGENPYDVLMTGGYAVSGTDPVTGENRYTNLKILSTLADFSVGRGMQAGLFLGYCKMLGADEPITGPVYARGEDIDYFYRISPRIKVLLHSVWLGFEVEHTAAAYGTPGTYGKVAEEHLVSNTRLEFLVLLKF